MQDEKNWKIILRQKSRLGVSIKGESQYLKNNETLDQELLSVGQD
jgi:hypothetical protein